MLSHARMPRAASNAPAGSMVGHAAPSTVMLPSSSCPTR